MKKTLITISLLSSFLIAQNNNNYQIKNQIINKNFKTEIKTNKENMDAIKLSISFLIKSMLPDNISIKDVMFIDNEIIFDKIKMTVVIPEKNINNEYLIKNIIIKLKDKETLNKLLLSINKLIKENIPGKNIRNSNPLSYVLNFAKYLFYIKEIELNDITNLRNGDKVSTIIVIKHNINNPEKLILSIINGNIEQYINNKKNLNFEIAINSNIKSYSLYKYFNMLNKYVIPEDKTVIKLFKELINAMNLSKLNYFFDLNINLNALNSNKYNLKINYTNSIDNIGNLNLTLNTEIIKLQNGIKTPYIKLEMFQDFNKKFIETNKLLLETDKKYQKLYSKYMDIIKRNIEKLAKEFNKKAKEDTKNKIDEKKLKAKVNNVKNFIIKLASLKYQENILLIILKKDKLNLTTLNK